MTPKGGSAIRTSRRRGLLQLAGDRNGIFTAASARAAGITSSALAYYARTGAIERVAHGVYRLTDYPSNPESAFIAAAAALGDDAVVSHESALRLYEVSDVAPSQLHFTIPRHRRYRTLPANDIVLHTTTTPIEDVDVVQHDGFRATSLGRSIVDAARSHTSPEQIEMAVREGLRRGLLTTTEIERAMRNSPERVRRLIKRGINDATP
jgi:predicted transcriptional regulator of viral defense system